MGIYKRGDIYWYRFNWRGAQIRESTKQGNARVASQMEAAHKTALAKGEVGIRERVAVPTLKEFAERDFLPFVRATSAAKPDTVRFYGTTTKNLLASAKLASLPMNQITAEMISDFIAKRHDAGMEISTINRDLATQRRMFRLTQEWSKISSVLPRVRMLPGEKQRERVLSNEEERKYVAAATELGNHLEDTYIRATQGIRAMKRGEVPIRPDAYLLRGAVSKLTLNRVMHPGMKKVSISLSRQA
jgi:hypothetical protein